MAEPVSRIEMPVHGHRLSDQISDKLDRLDSPGAESLTDFLRPALGRAHQETNMKKMLLALATSAVLAAGTLAPTTADARCRGCWVGAGVLGGLIVGSAIANAAAPRYYYEEPAPVYVRPAPGACYAEEEVWSPRRQAYIVRPVRVPCY
jgi:hypothetical protein